MKALVLWCRWNDAKLRLYGRDEDAVWGELVFADRTERFRFQLATRLLAIGEGDRGRALQLDDMGVAR